MNLSTRARIDHERTIPLSRYIEDGYYSRYDYLEALSDPRALTLADLMGPDEDFDGLITMLEDQI